MKKKLLLMGIAGILVVTAIVGGTLAGFNAATPNSGVADINMKALSIELTGTETEELANGVVPGETVPCPYYVVNDISEGYTAYTRVTIYKKWSEELADAALDSSKIHLFAGTENNMTELKTNADGSLVQVGDWIVWYADDEQVILYYTKPLAAEEVTSHVVDFVKIDSDINNDYTDQQIVLEFETDAVQSASADKAMPSEWGVYPTIENDIITNIEE